ncbi:MAG: universal stress protein [Gemmatimonadota bacterium]
MSLLVAVDFSVVTERQVAGVERLAAPGRVIHVLHVAEPDPDFVGFEGGPDAVRDQIAAEFRQEHRQVQALAARLRDAGFEATGRLVQGPTVETILEQAEKLGTDAIVVGSHGRSALFDLVVGSVSAGVIRQARVPVLVVPSR